MPAAFHMAIPVRDLEAARDFYGRVLGCAVGQGEASWQEFDFFGHQLSAHLCDDACTPVPEGRGGASGRKLPVPHFGVVLSMPDWVALSDRIRNVGVAFLVEPQIRFPGQPEQQGSFLVRDPSGNALEFRGEGDMQGPFAHNSAVTPGE